jgi:beta-glucosidase
MTTWSPAPVALAALGLAVTIASTIAAAPPASPAPARAARGLAAYDAEAKALLATMTLEEKVGQMTQPDQSKIADPTDVRTYFLGSVLSGGDSDPAAGNSLQAWTDRYDELQKQAIQTRLKIPILYGVDAVHGHNNVLGAVVFPHDVALGATRDARLVEEVARITAEEVRATGIQWAFAPCIAVARDVRWGRTYESYSEDPALVAELGAAAVRGFQGPDLGDPRRILACAKHYVGDGGTSWNSAPHLAAAGAHLDQGDTRLSEADLRRIHLPGYPRAIAAGVGSIMVSYNSWNGEKLSGHAHLLTDVLKGELGFEGFLVSDYNALDQLPGDRRAQTKLSINAGMDMVMVPEKYKEFFAALKDLAEKGEVPMARIDDAVLRILRVKFAMRLMDPGRSPLADRTLQAGFGAAAHRDVARRAVRESLVLLKNDGKTLPLAKTAKRIVVAGKNADDIGSQCGGWTVDWQGKSAAMMPGGTTILAAIKAAAKGEVSYSRDGSGAAGADVAVVVTGEKPYAEFRGDREDLALDKEDAATVASLKKAGLRVVVVVVSGRPLILGDSLAQADAVVAAWLPGTEGGGVADVLFGDYKPTGKLSFTWPRSMAQIPMSVGDAKYDPLFAYGFGLTY